MTMPCKNCLVISRCIAGILNIKNQWIEEERIIDNEIDDAEVYDEFDSEVMGFLTERCELFSEYFPVFIPAYNQVQYPPDCVFHHGISEEEWHARADVVDNFFKKYYPNQ